jgi:hypothetical protein
MFLELAVRFYLRRKLALLYRAKTEVRTSSSVDCFSRTAMDVSFFIVAAVGGKTALTVVNEKWCRSPTHMTIRGIS